MPILKIGILYNTTELPWGGINTFFRNFNKYAKLSEKIDLVENNSKADIILTAGHYRGPGKLIKPMHLRNLTNSRSLCNLLGIFSKKGKKKIVFRLDGLRSNYAGHMSSTDDLLINNLSYADGVIFQSEYSKESFNKFYIPSFYETDIIQNGADTSTFYPNSDPLGFSGGVKLVSNSWSTNSNKGFEIISAFSELNNVTVSHIGRWPDNFPSKKVILLGEKDEKNIAVELRKHHFLLFPSENEACSNTVVEALASGLPVLYHKSGGTIEQCKYERYGIPIPTDNTGNTPNYKDYLIDAVDRYEELLSNIIGNIQHFSFSYCLENYIKYFHKMLKDNS
ncbi:MAG: glycosyltransferase [Desulfobacterales bacterium]|nr:glycosyltransferase [Desulfobacterales bacterium]